jgi:hypothetical protein
MPDNDPSATEQNRSSSTVPDFAFGEWVRGSNLGRGIDYPDGSS